MEARKEDVKRIMIFALLFLNLNSYCQNKIDISKTEIAVVQDTHLQFMLNFLIQNKYYDEIGREYAYKHYNDKNQAFFNVKSNNIENNDIYGYHFYSGEAHAAEFIMLINKKADNILVLGYGDFSSNKFKLVNFLNNNVNSTVDREKVLAIMLEKLKQIYDKSQ